MSFGHQDESNQRYHSLLGEAPKYVSFFAYCYTVNTYFGRVWTYKKGLLHCKKSASVLPYESFKLRALVCCLLQSVHGCYIFCVTLMLLIMRCSYFRLVYTYWINVQHFLEIQRFVLVIILLALGYRIWSCYKVWIAHNFSPVILTKYLIVRANLTICREVQCDLKNVLVPSTSCGWI